MRLDYTDFEASGTDRNGKDAFFIERKGVDVIEIGGLEASGEILNCEFRILDPDLSIDDVKGLVYVVLLGRFLRNYYLGRVKYVKFLNSATGEESRNVYLG
ncbi:MAG TPA: hypothetical protein VGD52_04390 [Pseudoduganella sp.]